MTEQETCLLQLDFSLRMLNLQQSVLGLAEQAGQRFGPDVKDKTWMEGKVTTSRDASLHLKYFDSYLGGKKTPFIYRFS